MPPSCRPLDPPRSGAGRRPPRLISWIPLAALTLLGCTPTIPVVVDPSLPTVRDALVMLEALPRHKHAYYQAPYPYQRLYFCEAWWDVDGNGRGTRDDVLASQLRDVTYAADGNVASGAFMDPYTGLEVDYVRGRTETDPVVVDHVVSLWEAWATGAWAWTTEDRLAFANDPGNLVVTTFNINEDKGPQNAARWHPTTRQQECTFALQVVATKSKYGLEVHDNDRTYLHEVLTQC